MLTLENSVVKVKRATNVTEIEQWTTVLTTYMSVFTHEFPNRAQEFLQYMSIIRHAAQCHRGLGWCIYDFKFRRKAALNKCINWSEIDQQLWLMIFTIPSAVLREEYPLFSNGPQKHASFGAERGGICHDFNTTSTCKRNETREDSAIFVSSAMAHRQDISVQSLKGCERTKSIHPTTNAISTELSANVLTYLTPTPIVYSHLTRRHTSWAPRHAVRATIMRQFKIWGLNWI